MRRGRIDRGGVVGHDLGFRGNHSDCGDLVVVEQEFQVPRERVEGLVFAFVLHRAKRVDVRVLRTKDCESHKVHCGWGLGRHDFALRLRGGGRDDDARFVGRLCKGQQLDDVE